MTIVDTAKDPVHVRGHSVAGHESSFPIQPLGIIPRICANAVADELQMGEHAIETVFACDGITRGFAAS